ncbi:hypothetical protein C8R44DRAFT_389744 [Mycena epipterygia]|nr:hypothetical protein C8R44DRAFT_389744 [Mycena epipterygia]
MPEVPATSSSAWNALLSSTLSDTIEPRVERWRSGLDALLVFLGLFSAIVTAFLVNSLVGLTEDKVARTNELLVNLTEIVIFISGKPAFNMTYPVPFQPDPSDVRVNAFWSLSLTFSLSIAALAVGCRGFLNMIAWSRHKKASERLADIWTRWNAADRVLRPAIEALPQLLVFPVFLFIIGILDMLFSSVQELLRPPPFILFAFGLSVLCITVVAALLGFTIVDGSIHPASSPFQSKLAYTLHISVIPRLKVCASLVHRLLLPHLDASTSDWESRVPTSFQAQVDPTRLPVSTIDLYHKIVQLTHEDESLDQAAGALFRVIHERAAPRQDQIRISSQECATLRHLLSPEANIRSNRTAAWVIVRMQTVDPRRSITFPTEEVGSVMTFLAGAAKRSVGGYSAAALWDSPFIRAMAVMLHGEDRDPNEHPLVLHCLSSDHSAWDESLFGPPSLKLHYQTACPCQYSRGPHRRPPSVPEILSRCSTCLYRQPILHAVTHLPPSWGPSTRTGPYPSLDHEGNYSNSCDCVLSTDSAPHVGSASQVFELGPMREPPRHRGHRCQSVHRHG